MSSSMAAHLDSIEAKASLPHPFFTSPDLPPLPPPPIPLPLILFFRFFDLFTSKVIASLEYKILKKYYIIYNQQPRKNFFLKAQVVLHNMCVFSTWLSQTDSKSKCRNRK